MEELSQINTAETQSTALTIGYVLIGIVTLYIIALMHIWRKSIREAVIGSDGIAQWPEIVVFVSFLLYVLCILCGLLGMNLDDNMFYSLDIIVMFGLGASLKNQIEQRKSQQQPSQSPPPQDLP